MKRVERSALLPYTADQIFDVVNDVAAYPDFLPWCDESKIIESTESALIASLTISKSGMRQSFTTRNILNRPQRMSLKLVDGPFKTLEGDWRFTQLGEDGCRIEMTLIFEMDSRLAGMMLGRVFEKAADTLVDAFCRRADSLYGGRS